MFSLFRRGWWPGPAPDISPNRKMCSDCVYHSSALAGWQWDRCHHPKADMGSVVRNDQDAKCCDIRDSELQCGKSAKWFTKRPDGAREHCCRCGAESVEITPVSPDRLRHHCHACGDDRQFEFKTRGDYFYMEPVSEPKTNETAPG